MILHREGRRGYSICSNGTSTPRSLSLLFARLCICFPLCNSACRAGRTNAANAWMRRSGSSAVNKKEFHNE